MRKYSRTLVLPTRLQIFIKISSAEFPGIQEENFISRDSEFFTESDFLFGLGKISTGKNRLLGIQPSYISSNEKNGIVIFVPVKRMEQLYLFQSEKRNSYIYSNRT